MIFRHADAAARAAAHQRADVRSHLGGVKSSEVPVCFHSGSSARLEFPLYSDLSEALQAALSVVNRPLAAISVFSNVLYSHILVRLPRLKVVFAESSLGWGAYELELADHEFERQRLHQEPGELGRRSCSVGSAT